jgi:phospholipase D1/2
MEMKIQRDSKQLSLFKTAHNCWKVEKASHASMLVDCANYYRALHESIRKARHSIFVLGWDIDSRIELLRGAEAERSPCPNTFFDLIQWKAQQSPEVMIYLNRWDYSVFMAADRENFSTSKWKSHSSKNVFFLLDDQLPLGASHHQKIAVIDDEVAFCGGMDIAIGRWDKRQHYPKNRNRIDPEGNLKPGEKKFGPYHDVQIVVAGPVAIALAELARKRWRAASAVPAVPLRRSDLKSLPEAWPRIDVDFSNVDVAVALTMPPYKHHRVVRQIERLYLDMIGTAEHFIYMENQFFSRKTIAVALARRLKEKPALQVLLLSCYDPEGVMEKKSLWYGRVIFKDILEKSGVADRVVLAYPISHEKRVEKPVRIHSKLMIVDDRYLRVGSSNINNRSMAVDTECDLVIEGNTKKAQQKIASIRNDLIREHTGRTPDDIAAIISTGSVQTFLDDAPHSRQHIREVDDEQYRHERFTSLAIRLADPEKPLLPGFLLPKLNASRLGGEIRTLPWRLILVITLIMGFALIWQVTPLREYANPDKIVPLLKGVRSTPWALPVTLALYVLGTLIFFPHMIMTAVIVIIFAPFEALCIAMFGSVISGIIGFFIGRTLGAKSLRALIGDAAGKISGYANKGGVLGLTILRMVPVAPYTVVNLALGMMGVSLATFVIATFLGMLPGTLVSIFLGHSIVDLWQHPDLGKFLTVGGGLVAWICIIALSHFLARRWQKRVKAAKA